MNRVHNIRIKTIKWKYKQIKGVLAVFASAKLALDYIRSSHNIQENRFYLTTDRHGRKRKAHDLI